MSDAGQRERDREDLKRKILATARELFLEHGYDRTSMRMIADRISYSPTTIYLHFQDKDDLFHALHAEAFQRMAMLFAPLVEITDPIARAKAMGRVYLEFAQGNPELYDLMFIMKAPMKEAEWVEGQEVFDILKNTVDEAMQKGLMRRSDVEVTSFLIWSVVHGMAALYVRDRCSKVISAEKQPGLLDNGLAVFTAWLDLLRP